MAGAVGTASGSRLFIGVIAGIAAGLSAAALCFAAMRAFWPGYEAAIPQKSYDFVMLIARLLIGLISVVAAAATATRAARDNGQAGMWVGWLVLAASLPNHLYLIWNDYPAWYHFAYLGYIVPAARLTVAGMVPAVK
ncbi:MAG: hypothetical protein ACKOPQ_05780 [Novosphingobium sp.]